VYEGFWSIVKGHHTPAAAMQSGGKPYLKKEQRPLALCKDRKVSSFDPDGNIGAREMIVAFYFVRNRENKIRLIGCDEY